MLTPKGALLRLSDESQVRLLAPQEWILGGIHFERREITSFSIGKGVAHSDGGVNIPKW